MSYTAYRAAWRAADSHSAESGHHRAGRGGRDRGRMISGRESRLPGILDRFTLGRYAPETGSLRSLQRTLLCHQQKSTPSETPWNTIWPFFLTTEAMLVVYSNLLRAVAMPPTHYDIVRKAEDSALHHAGRGDWKPRSPINAGFTLPLSGAGRVAGGRVGDCHVRRLRRRVTVHACLRANTHCPDVGMHEDVTADCAPTRRCLTRYCIGHCRRPRSDGRPSSPN